MLEEVTSAIMYCREYRELLHMYYDEIAKERMHRDDYHLIEKHKALCLHLNMKRMLNQKSMWEWMRTKSGEKYGDVSRVHIMLSLSQTIGRIFPCTPSNTDRNTKNPANLIPAKYQYQKNCW